MNTNDLSNQLCRGDYAMKWYSQTLRIGLMAVFAFAVNACSEIPTYTRSQIDHELPFMAGVLVPRNDRDYPLEIFVGYLRPNDEYPDVVTGGDPLVARILNTVQEKYAVEIAPEENAVVRVEDEFGNVVPFAGTGKGFYRDEAELLNVRPGARYTLVVWRGGDKFYAKTIIPGDCNVLDIADGGTVTPEKIAREDTQDFGYPIPLRWSASSNTHFYRVQCRYDGALYPRIGHRFGTRDTMIFAGSGSPQIVQSNLVIEAVDSSYARLYRPGDLFEEGDGWGSWFSGQEKLEPGKRSNITSGCEGVGVFGSVNVTKKNFQVAM